MNPVIHLLLRLIIGPEHELVHISAGMTLELSHFEKIHRCQIILVGNRQEFKCV